MLQCNRHATGVGIKKYINKFGGEKKAGHLEDHEGDERKIIRQNFGKLVMEMCVKIIQ
jgi:hypothetical protein